MKQLKINNKFCLITIALNCISLFGCVATQPNTGEPLSNSMTNNSNSLTITPMVETVNIQTVTANEITDQRVRKASLLAQKMTQAEYTLMALNDKKFINQAMGATDFKLKESYLNCVYNHIEREQYQLELQGVANYLVNTYPDDIDAYIGKLDFLIPVVKQIYNHPEPVAFNSYDLKQSSALAILAPTNAQELMTTINDERYAPLLATIGLPAKRADGLIEDISIMQVDSMMGYVREAADKCR